MIAHGRGLRLPKGNLPFDFTCHRGLLFFRRRTWGVCMCAPLTCSAPSRLISFTDRIAQGSLRRGRGLKTPPCEGGGSFLVTS
jgi:hypothetical protein